MTTPYNPTPGALPTTLDLPQDAVDALVVETVNTNTAILADAIKQQETVIRAWVTLNNVTKSIGAPFEVALVSSYPSGAWTVIDGLGIQVPEPGMYSVEVVAVLTRATGEGTSVGFAVGYGSSMVGSFTIVGFGVGFRYDDAEAMPAVCIGGVPTILVTTPATTRFVLLPTFNNLTPETEPNAPGELHKFVITKIGELP